MHLPCPISPVWRALILRPFRSVAAGLLLLLPLAASAQIGGTGWTPKTVQFKIQWPTNAAESARYFVTNSPLATYHCLVYSNDGAFSVGNTTKPRTEQRFNPDYTSGEIQYQATLMARSNENSYCIFQIHTGDAQSDAFGSTTFMMFWFTSDGGSIHDYSGTELVKNLGNQWFQVNVDHNLVTGTIRAWINQKLVWTQQDNGAGDFYFKDGVYEQDHGPTLQMDTYITNILEWTSSGTNPPAAPTGLMATPTMTQIALLWNPAVGATNYNVKRSTISGGPYTNIAALTVTNFTDTGASNSPAFYYVVTATNSFGISSNSVQVGTPLMNLGFQLSAAPPAPSVITGNSTNFTVVVTTNNGFIGNVVLGVAGLPAGATASFNPPTRNTSGSSTLTIKTSVNSPVGIYPLTIGGTNGTTNHTTPVTLTLTALPSLPSFIGGPVLAGDNLVFSGTSSLPDHPYYLLSSTNLASPPGQWTPIVTNTFDDSGNFNFTNPMDANQPQLFYLLQVP